MVSPFSEEALDILIKMKVKYFKVASGEVTNHKLLDKLKKQVKQYLCQLG